MIDPSKTYLIVGLGLLGGKYALELTRAGVRVLAIDTNQESLDWALAHGYIAAGARENFEEMISQADHIVFGLYPTALEQWVGQYGKYFRPGLIFTDVSGVKKGLVEKGMCRQRGDSGYHRRTLGLTTLGRARAKLLVM